MFQSGSAKWLSKVALQSGSAKSKKGILSDLLNIPINTLRDYLCSLELM